MFFQMTTQGGVTIDYDQIALAYDQGIHQLIDKLDAQRGAVFISGFEYPGRYTCWDLGFYNPPLLLMIKKEQLSIHALNARGHILLSILQLILPQEHDFSYRLESESVLVFTIEKKTDFFSEEKRSLQSSFFTVIRRLLALFKCDDDAYLGLYGAFGYDLIFQFETLIKQSIREEDQRDLVLYLPDEIYIVDHRKEEASVRRYEFSYQGHTTKDLAREGAYHPYEPLHTASRAGDHAPGEYAHLVDTAKQRFACGDLFEVVPSQTFFADCPELPSTIFKRMCKKNPSPYGFFINLGEKEYLVGASPEMYVRLQGSRVETCPISGTIQRGRDAIEDAENIQTLLDSKKDFSELTMCTDVDRNDKSRICVPGSVKVLGRRQIEMYSRLIHTVDHVEGQLRPEFDAVDAFLTHMWVVTVTGAPKLWAMNFIEQNEKSPRRWYAGAVGWFGFNGNLNTGLVLRTLRIKEGIAEIRVGATLLYDSIPEAEEQETRLKASAFLDLLKKPEQERAPNTLNPLGKAKKVLLIDHQDSFVHTLANYIRQTGAQVETIRSHHALAYLALHSVDLVVLSPGPGKPDDFNLHQTIKAVLDKNIPLFGVCLGLQGIVEYFGGKLGQLAYPMHGKASTIMVTQEHSLWKGLASRFTAGRYHSLYALEKGFPASLDILAKSEDGIIMAIAHQSLPVYALQFHPETILSLANQTGLKIISNLMDLIP